MSENSIWKESVLDQCLIAHTNFYPDDPKKTLQELINWHTELALDSRVSERAAELVKPKLHVIAILLRILVELVELKDIKIKLKNHMLLPFHERQKISEWEEEYKLRQPIAWDVARAALVKFKLHEES